MIGNKYSYSYSPAHPLRKDPNQYYGEMRFLVGLMLIISLIILGFLIVFLTLPKQSTNDQLKSPLVKATAYV